MDACSIRAFRIALLVAYLQTLVHSAHPPPGVPASVTAPAAPGDGGARHHAALLGTGPLGNAPALAGSRVISLYADVRAGWGGGRSGVAPPVSRAARTGLAGWTVGVLASPAGPTGPSFVDIGYHTVGFDTLFATRGLALITDAFLSAAGYVTPLHNAETVSLFEAHGAIVIRVTGSVAEVAAIAMAVGSGGMTLQINAGMRMQMQCVTCL